MARRTTAGRGSGDALRRASPAARPPQESRAPGAETGSGGAASRFAERPDVRVAGARFSVTSLPAAIDEFVLVAAGSATGGLAVRFANAYSLALAARDPAYRKVLVGPGVTLRDGAPVARVVRRRSPVQLPQSCRVRGPSFFAGVLDLGRAAGLSHYLLGSTPETVAALRRNVEERYPSVRIAGTWSPPHGPLDAAFITEAVARVRAAGADVVWLGLGTPKQDLASAVLSERTQLPVVGVGAAFDFLAGTTREAPQLLRDHGLEWLFRLCTEPRRLWRRYLFGNIGFVRALVADEVAIRRERRGLRRVPSTWR